MQATNDLDQAVDAIFQASGGAASREAIKRQLEDRDRRDNPEAAVNTEPVASQTSSETEIAVVDGDSDTGNSKADKSKKK